MRSLLGRLWRYLAGLLAFFWCALGLTALKLVVFGPTTQSAKSLLLWAFVMIRTSGLLAGFSAVRNED